MLAFLAGMLVNWWFGEPRRRSVRTATDVRDEVRRIGERRDDVPDWAMIEMGEKEPAFPRPFGVPQGRSIEAIAAEKLFASVGCDREAPHNS